MRYRRGAPGASQLRPRDLELLPEVLSQHGTRRDQRVQVRVPDGARQLGRAKERAQQYGDAADAGDGEQSGHEVGALGEQDADACPLSDPGLQQSLGQPARLLLGGAEGQPLVVCDHVVTSREALLRLPEKLHDGRGERHGRRGHDLAASGPPSCSEILTVPHLPGWHPPSRLGRRREQIMAYGTARGETARRRHGPGGHACGPCGW